MPPRDFRLPDDFPELSIPDRVDGPPDGAPPAPRFPPVQRPAARPAQPSSRWREGDRVLAPWEPDLLYAGRVAQLQDDQALIQFDDGDAGWVLLHQIRPLAVERRQ